MPTAMTDLLTAANLGRVVLALALLSAGYYAGQGASSPRVVADTDTVRVEAPMSPGDLVDATTPQEVIEYQAPDTSDTRTDCIKVPRWLSLSRTSEAPLAQGKKTSADTVEEWRSQMGMRSARSLQKSAGPPYAITPLTSGRPRLSVGSEQVTLSTIDPHSGAGREYAYDVPRPEWALWPETEIRTTPWGLEAALGAGLRWRDWTVTGGYTIGADRRGWAVGVRWRPVRVTW